MTWFRLEARSLLCFYQKTKEIIIRVLHQSPTRSLQFYCPNFILHIYFVYIIYDKFDVFKNNCSNETKNLNHIVYFKHISASFNFIKSVWLIYIILLSRVTEYWIILSLFFLHCAFGKQCLLTFLLFDATNSRWKNYVCLFSCQSSCPLPIIMWISLIVFGQDFTAVLDAESQNAERFSTGSWTGTEQIRKKPTWTQSSAQMIL